MTCSLLQRKCSGQDRWDSSRNPEAREGRSTQKPASSLTSLSRLLWGDFFLDHWVSQPMPAKNSNSAQIASAICQKVFAPPAPPPSPPRTSGEKIPAAGRGRTQPAHARQRPECRTTGLHSQNRVANCCIRQQAAGRAAKVSRKIAQF